jgi:hypothetical protein
VRRFTWPLIFFQFVWLNIVLPGHTRGIVTVGDHCGVASCCANKPAKSGDKSPTPDQQKRCAICAFAAALSTPPAIDASLDLLGVGRTMQNVVPISAPSPDLPSANRERAPPVASA